MTARSLLAAAAALLVAVSALSACASGTAGGSADPSSSSPDAVSIEGEWRAEAPDEAFLRFDADGAVRGTDGCNGLSGTTSVSGQQVSFDLDLSTLRACVGLPTSFSDLGSAVVDGDVMTVRTTDGSEIVQLRRQ